jgi:RNA polymerase primary sigma factor
MEPNEFWAFVAKYPWLMGLISDNGNGKRYSWEQLIQLFSEEQLLGLKEWLTPATVAAPLELGNWFYYAHGYVGLEIGTDIAVEEPAQQPVVVPARKTAKKTKTLARRKASPKPGRQQVGDKPTARRSRSYLARNEDPSLDRYLREIGQIPLINKDEEARLTRRIKQGDKKALKTLTKANLRFVVSVAKRYQNQGFSLGDLINEGNIGLIKAAWRFDETYGFKFISYAVWWIRQAILQALAENSRVVRIPLNRVGALYKIGNATDRLIQTLGRSPTDEEIARVLEMSPQEVEMTLKVSQNSLSLDQPFEQDGVNTLLDVIEDEDEPAPDRPAFDESLHTEIQKALDSLSPREAEVIDFYFGLTHSKSLTLEEIGARFSLTRERIRQIKEKAIRRLRHASRARSLQAYHSV